MLVFLVGMATGALTMKLYARRAAHSRASIASLEKKAVLEGFKKDLQLDQHQVEKIEIVLDDFMKYVHDLQNQMDETRRYGREQILRILNEDQRKKFEKSLAEMQSRAAFR
jgi:uncharacterized membrane-anchored protein YhcB (DUF1043 family)